MPFLGLTIDYKVFYILSELNPEGKLYGQMGSSLAMSYKMRYKPYQGGDEKYPLVGNEFFISLFIAQCFMTNDQCQGSIMMVFEG